MRLYVLHDVALISAQYHADIHLRNAQRACIRFFSDALHLAAPEKVEKVTFIKDNTQIPRYFFEHKKNRVEILPPPQGDMTWPKWIAGNYANAWFIIDYASHFNQERKVRLNMGPLKEYIDFCKWIENGLISIFPKKEKKEEVVRHEEFPIALPNLSCDVGCITATKVSDIYQREYAKLYNKHRMKWTGRDMPPFMTTHFKEEAEKAFKNTHVKQEPSKLEGMTFTHAPTGTPVSSLPVSAKHFECPVCKQWHKPGMCTLTGDPSQYIG